MFLGPTSEQLNLLGNKVSARDLARRVGVPILEGTKSSSSSSDALRDIINFATFLPKGGKIILKAANGGGGRGFESSLSPLNRTSSSELSQKHTSHALAKQLPLLAMEQSTLNVSSLVHDMLKCRFSAMERVEYVISWIANVRCNVEIRR